MGKPLWFIPMIEIEVSARRAAASMLGVGPFDTPCVLTLFNKNALENYEFTNPRKLDTHCAYIAERDECPPYYARAIRPFPSSSSLR